MKNSILRCGAGVLALAGLTMTPGAVFGKDVTLHIQRDSAGSVVQSIRLAAWDYNEISGVLTARSVEGNRQCVGAASDGGQVMVLDGELYQVESITPPRSVDPTIVVRPGGRGVFPLCTAPAGPLSSAETASKGVANMLLSMNVIADGSEVRRNVRAGSNIRFLLGSPPRVATDLSDTLLCVVGPGATGTELRFVDTNGEAEVLLGIEAVDFMPSERVLKINLDQGLTCFAPTSDSVLNLPAPLSAGDPVACETVIEAGNRIFASGFEGTPPPLDSTPGTLEFAARLVRAPAIQDNESMIYEYIVQNCGTTALSDVRVREFWPGSGGTDSVRLEQASRWIECAQEGPNCNAAGGTPGYVDYTIPTLPPFGQAGSRIVLRADRGLDAGQAGNRLRIDAVAVVNDGTKSIPDHLARSYAVEVLQDGNIAPTLVVSNGTQPTQGNPFELDEDDGLVNLTSGNSFRLHIEDDDSGFNCAAGCVSISSSDPSVIAAGDVVSSYTPINGDLRGRLDLQVEPKPNAFGPVTLTVSAVDTEGGVSNSLQFFLDVLPQDDPPLFRLGAGGDFPDGFKSDSTKATEVSPTGFCLLEQPAGPTGPFEIETADCADHNWTSVPDFPDNILEYNNWLTQLEAGPGEDSQNVDVVVSLRNNEAGIIGNFSYSKSDGKLTYLLTGARGEATIRIRATDENDNETIVETRVIVANTPPTPDAVDGLEVAENFEGVVGRLTASDPDEGDTVQSWRVVSTTPASALSAFDIDNQGDLEIVDEGPVDFDSRPDGQKYIDVVVAASDGISEGQGTVRVALTDVDDEAPVLEDGLARVLQLDSGETFEVTPANLAATDPDTGTTPSDIRYRLTTIQFSGQILRDDVPLDAGSLFTQNQIDNGRISLVIDAQAGISFGGIVMTLEDTAGNVNPNPVTLNVNTQ